MKLAFIPWIVLFLPLAAAVSITLFTRGDRARSAGLSVGAVVAGFLLTAAFIGVNGWAPAEPETSVRWLDVGPLQVDVGLRLDPLSLMMLLVVTGVGSLIHIYSRGYMKEDPGYPRYFACLSLFIFSMLGIVLASNLLMMFVFWELVGVSSYLLIGFWFGKPAAADAAKKAFLTNRLGDFGFMLGILLVWATLGSLHFGTLEGLLKNNPAALGSLATLAGLLIFCGAAGKSAQAPFHVWLPDAMEGPTPVSALIHAATMVAAGVYLLCRVFFLLDLPGSHALTVIAWVGGLTSLMAALIAVQQNDIKRILAYSTLSQLGYMVMAVGVGGPVEAMYHLSTHAFFKALLFLGAGSVILALHHEQDIWRMGGLRKSMPVTGGTFLVGMLALCGVPPFSGFYSKDPLIAATLNPGHAQPLLFAIAVLVAMLTTFYMFRLYFVAFCGPAKSEAARHAHESPAVMILPLLILAVPATFAGFWDLEGIYARQFGQGHHAYHVLAMVASLGAVLFGFSFARSLYAGASEDPLPGMLGAFSRALRHRFYIDEFYEATLIRLQEALARLADWIDRWIIAGLLVRGISGTTDLFARTLRLVQTGNLQAYAFLFAFGTALLLYLVIAR